MGRTKGSTIKAGGGSVRATGAAAQSMFEALVTKPAPAVPPVAVAVPVASALVTCPPPAAIPEELFEKRELADPSELTDQFSDLVYLGGDYAVAAAAEKASKLEKDRLGKLITAELDRLRLKGVKAPGVSIGMTYSGREELDPMVLLANGVSADVIAASTKRSRFRFARVTFGKAEQAGQGREGAEE